MQIDYADNSLFSVFGSTITAAQTNLSSSYNVSSKNDFAACTCDITENTCDLLCCCDALCPSNLTSTWQTQNTCIDVSPNQLILSLSDCIEKRKKATQDELRYPLQAIVVNLRLLFCKVRDNTDSRYTYLSSLKSAQNESQYNALLDSSLTTQLTSSIKAASTTFTTRTNYLIGDNVLGTFDNQVLAGNQVFFPSVSRSGECQSKGSRIVFGKDVQKFRCTRTLIAGTCSNQYSEIVLDSYSDPAAGDVPLTAGTLQTVDSNLDLTPLASLPSQDCANVLVRGQFVITYDANTSIITGYQLNGVFKSATANTKIKQTFSLKFISSATKAADFKKSGSPGYVRGMPLLMGKMNNNLITLQTDGFQLKANDKDGLCDFTTTSIPNLYLENPIITFEQDLIYGCRIQRNFDALQTFCTTTQNPLLFHNLLTQGNYIGKFGNSNPAYINDWIRIGVTSSTQVGTFQNGICSINAGGKLEIYVSKLGNSDSVQYQVFRADFSTQTVQWAFTNPNQSVQTFNYILTVTFYEISQTPENFTAQTPVLAVQIPKESLYPFIISSAAYLKSISLLNIVFFVLLLLFVINKDEF